jgi:Tol biopolymer transport system component
MLSHYRLVEKIGEGGMGVVWKATDSALDREVAIKILPAEFAEDANRLSRFEREAKLLASLNHPNIATIHGLHESEGIRFLAMELVTGQDLAERLSAGPIASAEALAVARQLAEALEAAHEAGIVHRDLKPANIRLTPEGQVKVLDFGLAKAMLATDSGQNNPSLSPTITSAGTRVGMILGTAAYMSPEQAKGRPVDRRADIWAFGVVLYEMLSGRRLFQGDNTSEVLASVLMKEPDWSALPADTPPPVRNLLRRCLRRDPRSRLRDIGDARVAIEETIGGATIEDEASVSVQATQPRPRWPVNLAWAALVVLTAITAAVVSEQLRPEPAVVRFALRGSTPFGIDLATISPDGSKVAYVEDDSLWVRDLDGFEPRKLADAVVAVSPFWSPDSTRLGFSSNDKLLTIDANGGETTQVCETPDLFQAGTWGENGIIRFALENGPVYEVPARGGEPRVAIELGEEDRDFQDLHMLPEDKGTLFATRLPGVTARISVVNEDGRLVLLKMEGQWLGGPVYSNTGHVLYYRAPDNDGIWAMPFSLSKLETTGEPFLVVPNARWPSVSSNGTLAYLPSRGGQLKELIWLDRDGRVLGTIGQPQNNIFLPSIGPDGHTIAVTAIQKKQRNVWLHDIERGTQSQLTFTGSFGAHWLTENKVLFTTNSPSGPSIYQMQIDSRAAPVKVIDGTVSSVSQDGHYVVYVTEADETGRDLRYRVLDGKEEEDVLFLGTPHFEHRAQLSPDSHWLTYISNESGLNEVYLTRFPGGEGKWLVGNGALARWDPRGDRIYMINDRGLYEVTFEAQPSVSLGTPQILITSPQVSFWRGFDVSPDGQRFVAIRNVQSEDEQDAPREIRVVQNWFTEFKNSSR